MQISKLDKKVLAAFPELSRKDLNTCTVLRFDELRYFQKNRTTIRREELKLDAVGVTLAEAVKLTAASFDGTSTELNFISTMGLFRMLYLAQASRERRIAKIAAYRKIVALGTSAILLYKRKAATYGLDVNTFIADYGY